MLTITPIPAFNDNYIWAMTKQTQQTLHCAVVDPGDAAPVVAFLQQTGAELSTILLTHHHHDHIGGVAQLCKQFSPQVYGPSLEAKQVVMQALQEGDVIEIKQLGLKLNVLDVPGHTLGHIAYHDDEHLFCGDTLFSAGCGRLFEGSPKQMYTSLAKFAALADETKVYCTHEYTQANLVFADAVECDNFAMQQYKQVVAKRREQGKPTLPSSIGLEKAINPFLRCQEPAVKQAVEHFVGHCCDDDVAVFTHLREWKDQF